MERTLKLPDLGNRLRRGRSGDGPSQHGPARRAVWAIIAVALVLLGVGAILVSTSFDTPVEAKRLGRNVPVNEGARDPADISSHNSPTLVRNPRDGLNLVVANRIDSPRFSCTLHTSFDGGTSWQQTAVPAPKGERLCYAPDVAFGADGTLYFSFVTLRGRANAPNAAWLASSRDRGRTLSKPVKVLGRHSFQVRLATDPAAPRRVYLTWLQASDLGLFKFTETGNPIRAIRSDDGGHSWGRPVRVSSSARARVVAPAPAVGPKGDLYVLYLDLGDDRLDYEGGHRGRGGPPYAGPWKLVLARSSDRGRTWQESLVEDRLVPAERFVASPPPFPSLACNRDSGRLYAGFDDRRLGDPDVWVWSLRSGAKDWKGPVRVNDTARRDGTSQYLPKLDVAPDGRLDVLYYDRRADRRDAMNEVSLQYSSDQGNSFGERIRVSDRPFSSRIGYGSERRLADLGSRLGLVSTDSRAYGVWSDTRGGTRATGKQDLARAVVAFSDPPRLSDPVKFLLRFGGIALVVLGAFVLGMWVTRGEVSLPRPARR